MRSEEWVLNCSPEVPTGDAREGARGLDGLEQYVPGISPRSKEMPLVNLVFALIIVGVALWLINRFIPMASSIKTILNVVVVVSVGIWVLQATGLWGSVSSYRV